MRYEEAVAHFGSQMAIARLLDCGQSTVAEWRVRGIPVGRQYQLERLSLGALRAEDPVVDRHAAAAAGHLPPARVA